jgi:phage terminase large subunit-like protein
LASTTVERSRTRRRATTPRPPAPWWGDGRAPHLRWPGSFIEIRAVWSTKRARWESPDGRYYFDVEAADKACDFYPTFLTHHIGEFAGQSFTLLDWQRCATRAVFGWLRSSDGLRRFRKVFVFVPKGNGKSPWASGGGIYLTLCDGEEGAEVYALAADKLQARIVHKTARVMVQQSADLSELCEVLTDSIYSPQSHSMFQVLSADAKTKSGVRPHGIIMDELQEQPNRDLLETLEQSMGKRRQPLLLMLAHAGDDDESICYEEYTLAKAVISGNVQDETYLPIVFEIGDKDDWRDPEAWRKANPAYGITVKQDDMERQCRAAQNEPRKKNAFLRYRLNRWTNDAIAWIQIEDWDSCDEAPSYEDGLLTAAGLDMAQKIDLAALSVVVRHPRPRPLYVTVNDVAEQLARTEAPQPIETQLSINFAVSVYCFFWMPEDTMRKREKEDRVPYSEWAREGLITPTPGVLIDEDRILSDIKTKIVPSFALRARRCGYDPAFVSTSLLNGLAGAGLQMVETKQNYQMMNVPCQALYGLIQAKWLRHGTSKRSHPLRWCAENVAIRQDDAGRIRPVKPKNQRKRIDGIVATAMGLDQLLRAPGAAPNGYNERAARGEPVIRTIEVSR